MPTTTQQMRAWRGPAVFSFGFRPFFLGASVWAALAMAAWLGMLTGVLQLPVAVDPVSWHAQALLFGYVPAVVAGFLLTAVPNWTGRLPIVGWPLCGLFVLWLAGRITVSLSSLPPPAVVAALDMAMPVALAAAIAREIVIGRNWRNLIVLGLLAALIAGNVVFHLEAASGEFAAGGTGVRIGLSAVVMMITVIGGRIVPSFTRNWLVRQGDGGLPASFGGFDRFALILMLTAVVTWTIAPGGAVTAVLLLSGGTAHLLRLSRWQGARTAGEPLLWVLHLGYACVPVGALLMGAAILWPGVVQPGAAQHLWMAGAVGVMTLAVMTRATLGHTGRQLTAGRGTTAIFAAIILAVAVRLIAGQVPELAAPLLGAAAALWIAAFAGFAILYGPLLVGSRGAG